LPENVEKVKLALRNMDTLPQLEYDDNLHNAAYEYCYYINNEKTATYYQESDLQLRTRIKHYLESPKLMSEIVNYAAFNPTEMICSFLIREFSGDQNKQNQSNLLNRQMRFFGVCERFIREKTVLVLIMTDSNKPKVIHDKNFREEIIQDLLNVRMYPKTYMKFVKLPYGEYNPFQKLTITSSEEEILLDFLSNTRSFGELVEQPGLNEACQKYVYNKVDKNEEVSDTSFKMGGLLNKIVSDNNVELKVESLQSLKEIIEPYGHGFSSAFNIAVNNHKNLKKIDHEERRGNIDTKAFIIDILLNKNYRENLFSTEPKHFGAYAHHERGLLFMIFTNFFVTPRQIYNYDKVYQKKAPRPDLTEDEIELIRNDYMRFDKCQTNKLFPTLICKIFEENNLVGQNFIYYCALQKYLSSIPKDEHDNPLDINMFVTIVKEFMAAFTSRDWVTCFNSIKEKARINLEYVQFTRILNDVNFKFTEEESEVLFRNICYPEPSLNQRTFVSIMTLIGNNAEKAKRLNESSGLNDSIRSRSPGTLRNSLRKSMKF
jgi:hypothetical protein